MELSTVTEALGFLTPSMVVSVSSDSQYVRQGSLRCLVHMLMKEEKFLKGCTHKAAQVSAIHSYVEDLEGQEA
jgi:ribonuclease HI